MIYTVTFNPALDYYITVEDFKEDVTNKTVTELILPGGKGLNVSQVLNNLGFENIALGFAAGFTGEEVCRLAEEAGCKTDFIRVGEGMSRINIKFQDRPGMEINGKGPEIDEKNIEKLFEKLDKLNRGDILVLAGSIPPSVSSSVYCDICSRLADKGILLVVDATREALKKVLPLKPFLIKPNHHELGELFGVTINTTEEAAEYAKKLQKEGAVNVLISMAEKGAVLVAQTGRVYTRPAPEGKVVNAVGAGDSMVAGFLAGFLKTGSYEQAFKMGIAAGSASAFSEKLATKEEVDRLLEQMK